MILMTVKMPKGESLMRYRAWGGTASALMSGVTSVGVSFLLSIGSPIVSDHSDHGMDHGSNAEWGPRNDLSFMKIGLKTEGKGGKDK